MKVLPLKGVKSFHAMRSFNHVLLGLKMLPAHMAKDYDKFYAEIEARGEAAMEAAIREATAFVALDQDEIENVLSFVTDANDVPIGAANIKNLAPDQIFEGLVSVFLEISRIKIDLVTADEKKK